jgi:hypothetical protein
VAQKELSPAKTIDLANGFMASKVLLSAIELGVFTELAKGPLDAETLRKRLKLHPRSTLDFFDALVSLGMLRRIGGDTATLPKPTSSSTVKSLRTLAVGPRCSTSVSIDFGVR